MKKGFYGRSKCAYRAFEAADGGTLFLDEIVSLSLPLKPNSFWPSKIAGFAELAEQGNKSGCPDHRSRQSGSASFDREGNFAKIFSIDLIC